MKYKLIHIHISFQRGYKTCVWVRCACVGFFPSPFSYPRFALGVRKCVYTSKNTR